MIFSQILTQDFFENKIGLNKISYVCAFEATLTVRLKSSRFDNMKRLIYDIGAHRGDDTAYYLQCGYNVIAVEANPALCNFIRERFANEIVNKKLILLETAIATEGKAEISFFVSDDSGESSLFENRLQQAGGKYKKVKVNAGTLSDIFIKYGKGFYCKMDIEGGDIPALQSLGIMDNLPDYFSVEICGLSLEQLAHQPSALFVSITELERLGYTKFKLVDQYSLATLGRKSYYSRQRNLFLRLGKGFLKMLNLHSKHLNLRSWYSRKHNYSFTTDTSGPFAEDISGKWSTAESTKKMIAKHFAEYYKYEGPKKYNIFWVDVHAAR